MVGTRPIERPARRAGSSSARSSAFVRTILIGPLSSVATAVAWARAASAS